MTSEAFRAFLRTAWRPDFDGARQDSAPGETFETVKGITAMTWQAAQDRGIVPSGVTLGQSTDDQLTDVLFWACWTLPGCQRIEAFGRPDLAIVVASEAMAAGWPEAMELVQGLAGVKADHMWGNATQDAVQRMCADKGRDLVGEYTRASILLFQKIAGNKAALAHNLTGWTRRSNAFADVAWKFAAQQIINNTTGSTEVWR